MNIEFSRNPIRKRNMCDNPSLPVYGCIKGGSGGTEHVVAKLERFALVSSDTVMPFSLIILPLLSIMVGSLGFGRCANIGELELGAGTAFDLAESGGGGGGGSSGGDNDDDDDEPTAAAAFDCGGGGSGC